LEEAMKSRSGILMLTAALALAGCDMNEQQESAVPTAEVDVKATEASAREDESYDALFREAGKEFDVPPALLKSISFVQTRYQMVQGAEEFEGRPAVYGLMALSGPVLEEGAKLAGVTVEQAKKDARSNVRAAAALLSNRADALKIDRTQAATWAPAVAEVSGIDNEEGRRSFVHNEVFRVARLGLGTLSREWAASGQGLAVEELGTQTQALAGPDYAPAIWRPSPNFNALHGGWGDPHALQPAGRSRGPPRQVRDERADDAGRHRPLQPLPERQHLLDADDGGARGARPHPGEVGVAGLGEGCAGLPGARRVRRHWRA
jgi:hypothetical protein